MEIKEEGMEKEVQGYTARRNKNERRQRESKYFF
jgi:hypothetical protein